MKTYSSITIGPFWKLHFNYVSLGKGQKDLSGKCEIAYTIHHMSIQEERVRICQSAPGHSIIVESPSYCQTRKLEESRGLNWSTLKRADHTADRWDNGQPHELHSGGRVFISGNCWGCSGVAAMRQKYKNWHKEPKENTRELCYA